MGETLSKILPIFLLMGLGLLIRRFHIISESGIQGIKKFIVDIGLPIVLFKVFFTMELQSEYILVVAVMIAAFLLVFMIARVLRRFRVFSYKMLPYTSIGFAFGLFGIPLFQIVFGESKLYAMSILGAANELFLWILLLTFLGIEFKGEKFNLGTIKKIAVSPNIICITLGLLLNLLDLRDFIISAYVLNGVYNAVVMVAGMVAPLMLIIVGYGIVINKKYIAQSVKYVIVRMALLFIVGYTVKLLLIDRLVQDTYFDIAFFTLLTLPPPFLIPTLAEGHCEESDINLANNIVVVDTLVSVILFVGYVVVISATGMYS